MSHDGTPELAPAVTHAEYISTLHRPSDAEFQRISEIQCRRESEIDKKYHTHEEHEAATKIQKAYRGHRTRRELNGLALSPSARWTDAIKELRYRAATITHEGPESVRFETDGRPRAPSDVAKSNWRRIASIAEHVGAGESPERQLDSSLEKHTHLAYPRLHDEAISMLLDTRYFLEMVDQKHRYGTNLMIYHEEWTRSKTTQNFFYWLDRGQGRHVNMPGCSRERLDKERIRYLSKDERINYLVRVDEQGKLHWQKNDELITTSIEEFKDSMVGIVSKGDLDTPTFESRSVARKLSENRHLVGQIAAANDEGHPWLPNIFERSDGDSDEGVDTNEGVVQAPQSPTKKTRKKLRLSPGTILNHLMRASIKPDTWIYVSDTVGRLYVGIKTSGAFQHASFLSGARISSAGLIGITKGQLVFLSPLSGHYRPTAKSFKVFVNSLQDQGVDLSQLRISKALQALEGLEYWTRTKKSVHDVVHHARKDGSHARKEDMGDHAARASSLEATHASEEHELQPDREHKKGLARLMDDLHVRGRHSSESKREEE